MAIRAVSLTFGALYGYNKPEKKQQSDFWKFLGITAPATFFYTFDKLSTDNLSYGRGANQAGRVVGALVGGPLVTGWLMCIGNEVGKMARKSLNDS